MKKIKLVGYIEEKNLGDQILADSAEYLIVNSAASQLHITKLDLKEYFRPTLLERIKNKFGFSTKPNKLVEEKIDKANLNDFSQTDAIIFVGGGMIKYYSQECWKHVSIMIGIADKLNIPVYLHAVGVEGYNELDERCLVLKNYINKSVVKKIATRDDLDLLNSKYIDTAKFTELVADSAVHCNKVYSVTKKPSEIIGVGLVRGEIFKDHGKEFSRENIVKFYACLLKNLEKTNTQYQLFTNGLSLDEELLNDIRDETGLDLDVRVPKNSKELVQIISSFKGVVAARLHACIISYSLDIPVVGLVWNNKLSMFGKHIGYADRFIDIKALEGKHVLNVLKDAMNIGYDEQAKSNYINTVQKSMSSTLEEITGEK